MGTKGTDTKWYEVTPDFDQGPQLGVLRLDGWGEDYLPLKGDVDHKASWVYPIIHEVVENVTFDLLCNPTKFKEEKETVLAGVTGAVQKLIEGGATSLIANCGLFMWLHATGIIEAAVDKAVRVGLGLGLRGAISQTWANHNRTPNPDANLNPYPNPNPLP